MLALPPAELQSISSHRMKVNSLLFGTFLVCAVLLSPTHTAAQGSGRSSVGTGGNHIVTGFVFFPSGRRAEGNIIVKLQSYTAGELSVTADSSGAFTFTSIAPGNYVVVIDAGKDYEIARETVFIDSDVNLSRSGLPTPSASRRYTVMIHLQPKREDRQRASVVNASLAEVPDNARKLYEKSLEFIRAGDTLKAVDTLKSAIQLYPHFVLAVNELGVQYLKLGRAQKAVEALNDAVKLDPQSFTPRLNLGIALLEARQFAESEVQLNEALKLNRNAPTPHLYLGLVLVHLNNNDEAEKELLQAVAAGGDHVPLAHYYLGGLYWKKKAYAQAVEQLEKYLQLVPNAPDAERIKTTIKELRTKI